MPVAIAFTMKNLLPLTQQAVKSIVCNYPRRLILVDDWSDDGTTEWVLDQAARSEEVIAITDPLTLSLAGKWNLAAEAAWVAGCEAVVICNNDIVFHPKTLDAMIGRWLRQPPKTKLAVDMVTAHNVRGHVTIAELPEVQVASEPSEAPHPDFSCFLLPRRTWDAVGAFDENFVPCYYEDGDYHYRMGLAGLKAISTTAAPYYHIGSQTQNSVAGGLCDGSKFMDNHSYFKRKHGCEVGDEKYNEVTTGWFYGALR